MASAISDHTSSVHIKPSNRALAAMTLLLVVLALLSPAMAVTMVQEVFLGETVQLRCPSNDDDHRFQFWRLQRENLVIGPTNKYNRDKFRYTVIDGTLTIRGVSSNERGLYTCVCKHLTDESFNLHDVELIVHRAAWMEQGSDESNHVESYDDFDNATLALRVVIVISVAVILTALILAYNMYYDKQPRFRALDEESGREVVRPLTRLDSHGLDTELPRPSGFDDVRLVEPAGR